MSNGRIVEVQCQCGKKLFKYYKGGRGRLIKCFLSRITHDYIGITNHSGEAQPHCPKCHKDLGVVTLIRGKPALKLNQGAIKKITI